MFHINNDNKFKKCGARDLSNCSFKERGHYRTFEEANEVFPGLINDVKRTRSPHSRSYLDAEQNVIELFKTSDNFHFKGQEYHIIEVGKPQSKKGEPKTDVYISGVNENHEVEEIKISIKKKNADFLENKISLERAEMIFGNNWQSIIKNSIQNIEEEFKETSVVHLDNTLKNYGFITLGWKFELMNKKSGRLSGMMELSEKQVMDIYSGLNLPEEKRNAKVNGKIIKNSGVANYIYIYDSTDTKEDILNNIIPISEYIKTYPNIFFACKALNYNSLRDRYDGNRPLAVQVFWETNNDLITPVLNFKDPLTFRGDAVADKLKEFLKDKNLEDFKHLDKIRIRK